MLENVFALLSFVICRHWNAHLMHIVLKEGYLPPSYPMYFPELSVVLSTFHLCIATKTIYTTMTFSAIIIPQMNSCHIFFRMNQDLTLLKLYLKWRLFYMFISCWKEHTVHSLSYKKQNKNHNKRKNAIENYGNFVHAASQSASQHLLSSQVVKAVLVFVAC